MLYPRFNYISMIDRNARGNVVSRRRAFRGVELSNGECLNCVSEYKIDSFA